MSIQLVVFDLAGTTVIDRDFVSISIQKALDKVGVRVEIADVNEVMGLFKPLAISELIKKRGENPEELLPKVPAIYQDFEAIMVDFYRNEPGIVEIERASAVFRFLKDHGVKVGLDTGFARVITETIIQRMGWEEAGLIDTHVSSDEVAQGRPAPDLLLKAMERAGVDEVKLVAKIGDTPSDLGEGMNAGAGLVVGVTQGTHTKEQLEGLPHHHLIGTVAELPALLTSLGLVS